MSDEEENSFLLVGMENDENISKIDCINRVSTLTRNNTEITEKKIEEINTEGTNNKKIIKEEKKEGKKERKKTCFEKFIHIMLSLDEKKKKKKKNNILNDEDYFMFGYFSSNDEKIKFNQSLITELSYSNFEDSFYKNKKKSIIKNILELKKENAWNEFIEEYKKEKKEDKKIKKIFKAIFNINSDFIRIWKIIYSLFYVIVFYLLFLQFIFYDLIFFNQDEIPLKRIKYSYYIINFMFLADLFLSTMIILSNGGSLITYLKIPIKIYLVIPFPLKKEYILYILPKFFRIDLFKRLFNIIEQFVMKYITSYIPNYNIKIFIRYINRLFSNILEFGLYAHFACCLYSYLDDVDYPNSLYYTVEIITTIGYGDHSPKNIYSMALVMITICIGMHLVILTNININFLSTKVHSFSRTTSQRKKLELFIFRIQSSTDKLFPKKLKESLYDFINFSQRLSYNNIKSENSSSLSLCKQKTKEDILNSSLNFLKLEFNDFFTGCEIEFINSLFEVLKPKIFKKGKTIINIGQKVDNIYFLLNGILYALDKDMRSVFSINNNSIFCEYEFITRVNCEYYIKVHPYITAYGFIIKRKDWDIISKKYIFSSNKFIDLILSRHILYKNKINEKIDIDNSNENIDNDRFIENINQNILYNINEHHKNILDMENSFINFKNNLFKYISKTKESK